ncbi:MAG: penicillin-binding transpeptidase domain-containing protein [Phycisphaerae bacterium]|nr:penicillin-binding transpeptidase domain-containing protein [Phycisphaerae bacterium]
MYNRRLKIFAFLCVLFTVVCIVRLGYIQLYSYSAWQSQLEKIRTGASKVLPALRGKILDRNGKVLAADEARFALCIDYKYTRLADERFWQVQILRNIGEMDAETVGEKIRAKYAEDFNSLNQIIFRCAQFRNQTFEQVKTQINEQINDPIWQLRLYLAWKRKCPREKFETAVPDERNRLVLASQVDIAEMHQSQELFQLDDDDEVLAAQLKFLDTPGVEIQPMAERVYPYQNLASQLIGWVRPAGPADNDNFIEEESGDLAGDWSERYMNGDVTGVSGVEYVCESFLRGRRGRIVYNIDNEVVRKTETVYGGDVKLTIDIDLQGKIENWLDNKNLNPQFGQPAAIAVIDVNSTDILAYVSLPDFDLNRARYDYSKLLADKNKPTLDRVINKHYPPGSSAKPIILAAGLAEQRITPGEVISCPSAPPPKGWPRCWIERTYGYGHDEPWAYEGGNKARNAIRGSCNIYFSRLATRIPPQNLQGWLYNFGFGRTALLITDKNILNADPSIAVRSFSQTAGIISSNTISDDDVSLYDRPPIDPAERRFFGIGQGNLRATALQVANAFAALAREGVFKRARIIETDPVDYGQKLDLGTDTIATIFDGMRAVVSEQGGTGYNQFANSGFDEKGIKVFGKTGSTEKPYNAWFAGFAKNSEGKTIAFAVLIEGGQHGGSDAGPIARDLIGFCYELGYLK